VKELMKCAHSPPPTPAMKALATKAALDAGVEREVETQVGIGDQQQADSLSGHRCRGDFTALEGQRILRKSNASSTRILVNLSAISIGFLGSYSEDALIPFTGTSGPNLMQQKWTWMAWLD
jgi:hypothetical protein